LIYLLILIVFMVMFILLLIKLNNRRKMIQGDSVKWTIAGYYWDGKEHYVIYQNEDGNTKMVLESN